MLTGSENKASLQDGRKVCFQGRQITDLAGRLASFKRPRTIEVLAELPKNSVGKIAKAQLREPFWRDAGRLV
jgi:acyl-CoA synthetase (AMP-forming)/AMP-acid ligase II